MVNQKIPFWVELTENLTSSIANFLVKLEAHPTEVLTLDKNVGDLILALHDKVFYASNTPTSTNHKVSKIFWTISSVANSLCTT